MMKTVERTPKNASPESKTQHPLTVKGKGETFFSKESTENLLSLPVEGMSLEAAREFVTALLSRSRINKKKSVRQIGTILKDWKSRIDGRTKGGISWEQFLAENFPMLSYQTARDCFLYATRVPVAEDVGPKSYKKLCHEYNIRSDYRQSPRIDVVDEEAEKDGEGDKSKKKKSNARKLSLSLRKFKKAFSEIFGNLDFIATNIKQLDTLPDSPPEVVKVIESGYSELDSARAAQIPSLLKMLAEKSRKIQRCRE